MRDISFYRFCAIADYCDRRIMRNISTKIVNGKYKVTVVKKKR